MKKKPKKQLKFGLIGQNISYSFSEKYFTEKFEMGHYDNCEYANYDLNNIQNLSKLIHQTKGLVGLNITIPYKEAIIPHLDKLSKTAQIIGAVNCVTVSKKKKLKGYNTDYYGFKKTVSPLLKEHHKKALILGTGGASKAVAYALRKLKIEYDFVSRTPDEFQFGYSELTAELFDEYHLIINTTPLGTHPNIAECPELNYSLFTKKQIAYDLVYNPGESTFLRKAKENGAVIKNGYDMLVFQAEKAWKIWNE
ncbi:shikimate dehydrogenase family protein [Flavobacterium sp.]|jgi:shikimate dehydrogenase|uniref:shikimate dehydrogenase family protein n=1 Tax=Flavobacterium sp. TaxID=239 RepID=UPI0037C11090